MDLKREVIKLEEDMIRKALPASQYNMKVAARSLGLSLQGLINKVRRYHIPVAGVTNKPACPTCGRMWPMRKSK